MTFVKILAGPEPEPDLSETLTMERLTASPAYWEVLLASDDPKHVDKELNRVRKIVESPIEAILMCALSVVLRHGVIPLHVVKGRSLDAVRGRVGNTVAAQVPVGRHRVDIVLNHRPHKGPSSTLAIECDGAAFHRATAEQWQRDAERSAVLAPHFDGIVRFTGSAIFKTPMRCAEQACGFLVNEIISKKRPASPDEGE